MTTSDDRRGCPATAVLSYGFWQSEYGGRASVAGTTISLDNHPFEILGVIEPGFSGVDVGRKSDIYVPLCAEKSSVGKTAYWTGGAAVASCHRPPQAGHFDESGRGTAQNAGWSDHAGNRTTELKTQPAGDLSRTYIRRSNGGQWAFEHSFEIPPGANGADNDRRDGIADRLRQRG